MLFRTKYIDDFILERIKNGVDQFVILGAGLDARANRLPFKSSSTVWEIDFPEVLDYKSHILKQTDIPRLSACKNLYITGDLTVADWKKKLEEKGFDKNQRTVWILEGLLFYLKRDDISKLMNRISELSASGSAILYENLSPRETYEDKINPVIRLLRKEMPNTTDDPNQFIPDLGFTNDVKTIMEHQIPEMYDIPLNEKVKKPHVYAYFTTAFKP